MSEELFYIINFNHMSTIDHVFLFWGPDGNGYSPYIERAGLYSKEVANDYARFEESNMVVAKDVVDNLKILLVYDSLYMANFLVNNISNRIIIGVPKKNDMWKSKSSALVERLFITPQAHMILHGNLDGVQAVTTAPEGE